MTTMSDADITAFRAPALPVAPPRRRRWPLVLAGVLLLFVLCAALAIGLIAELADFAAGGVTISVDGETWRLDALHGMPALAVLAAGAVALTVVLLVVPLVVMLALLVAAASVGFALLVALFVVAAVCSPLLLPVLLLWWLLRRPRPVRPTAVA